MKVVILAGGLGTRLAEYTKKIPKPMIKISGKPIIFHIMKHYSNFGYTDFIIPVGYKGEYIRKYFNKKFKNWSIKIVSTGIGTMTGGRIKRIKNLIGNETFLLTYGDGLSSVNIKKLLKFHKKNKKIATLTTVRPPARFGAIRLLGNKVRYFKEKSKVDAGWINGGFFVFEPQIFQYLKNDKTFLEKEPLEKISKKGQLIAFKHLGFWQCMDTLRDKEIIDKAFKKKEIKF